MAVSLQGRGEDVRVVIADNGPGIAPAIRDRLFQFGISTKGEGGNGMGLWLVRQLVQRHGGTIEVESAAGQGTRFTILWPRRMPDTDGAPMPIAAGAGQ